MLRQLKLQMGSVLAKTVLKRLGMVRLTPEQDIFLDDLAGTVQRVGLRGPALLVLDAGRPLTFLGGQLLWLLQPALSLLLPGQSVALLAGVLEKPEAVSALIARLEASEA